MTNPNAEESLPTNLPDVEALIADYQQQLADVETEMRELMAKEDPKNGIFFATEIHQNRQKKNQLAVQLQFATIRKNRLLMEAEPF